jgi:predicted nucleic acid-binding Zn ribbon protein
MATDSNDRDRARPKTVQQVLGNVVARFGLERSLDDYRIWQAWDEVVGPAIARNAQPQKLAGNRLVVVVKNAGWMQELSLLRHDLTDRLNAWMGHDVIAEIYLVVGKVDAPTATTAGKQAARERADRAARGVPEPSHPAKKVTPAELEAAIASLWKTASTLANDEED